MVTTYKSNRPKAEAEIEGRIQRELLGIAATYERSLQMSFREPKSGRGYRRGRKRLHIASAPGEAPAIDTAALSKGVAHIISRVGKAHFSIRIGVVVQSGRSDIALFLEFGTSRMSPRPAWRPALEVLRASMSNLRGR